MLEGLNKILISFVLLSRLLLRLFVSIIYYLLRLFIDGSLNAVKLLIYGSSVIKTILREPRFPDKYVKV